MKALLSFLAGILAAMLLPACAIPREKENMTKETCPASVSTSELPEAPVPPNRAEREAAKRKGWNPNGTYPKFTAEEIEAQFVAGRKLMDDIRRAVDEGKKRFVVPKGQYRYSSTGHGAGHENAPLRFVGISNFTLEAYGVTFWMTRGHDEKNLHDVQSGIWINKCRDLVLRGFDLDYDPPSFLQGKVTKVDLERGTVEFETDPDMLHPKEFNSVANVNFYDENGGLFPQSYIHRTSFAKTGEYTYKIALEDSFMRLQRDEEMMARFSGEARVREGHYISMPMRTGSAIDVFDSENVTLEDINIYQTPGFAIAEFVGAGGHTYRRVKVIRRPGTRRLSVSAADLFHSNLVGKGPVIEECEFAYSFDDGINLHGRFATVLERTDAKSLVIMHHYGGALKTGSPIRFIEWADMFDQGEGIVESVKPIPAGTPRHEKLLAAREKLRKERGVLLVTDRFWDVRLRNGVDAEVGSWGDLMGLHNASGFLVKDSYFHDSGQRGALVNGASNGKFINCTWERFNGGFFITHESWYYLEGPVPRNVSFIGNRIINCGAPAYASDYNSYRRHMPTAGIFMVTMEAGGRGLRRVYALDNIEFIGNYFENIPSSAIGMNYVRSGLIKGNRFKNIAFGGVQNTAINLSMVKNVTIEDNKIIGAPGGVKKMMDLGVRSVNLTIDGVPVNTHAEPRGRFSLMGVERYRKKVLYRSGRVADHPDGDNGAVVKYAGLMPLPDTAADTEAYAFHPPWKGKIGSVALETDIERIHRYAALTFRTYKDNRMGDGVTFIVAIRDAKTPFRDLYRAHVPGGQDRRHTVRLDQSGDVTLRFIVDPGPNNDTGYDFLHVGGIELVEKQSETEPRP